MEIVQLNNLRLPVELTGTAVNRTITAEYTVQPGETPISTNFITSKLDSDGNFIKIAGYKFVDVIIVAQEEHQFSLRDDMYQRVLSENSENNFLGSSTDIGLYKTDYPSFVRDYKLSSNGGATVYLKEMRVFGNYLKIAVGANESSTEQRYLMLINLYN